MKVEAADPKVSGELLFPPADGIIGIVIRFGSEIAAFDDPGPGEQKEGEKKGEKKGKRAEERAGGGGTRAKLSRRLPMTLAVDSFVESPIAGRVIRAMIRTETILPV